MPELPFPVPLVPEARPQALEEVRFKTNLVPEPIVVEDDKLGMAIANMPVVCRR